MALDTSGGRGPGPLGGGQRSPYEAAYYSPSGGQKPVWTGGRAGNPTQYRQDLSAWQRAQKPAAAQPTTQPDPIKVPPSYVPQMFLSAAPGYGVMRPGYQFMGPGTSQNTAPVALNQHLLGGMPNLSMLRMFSNIKGYR